MLTPGSQITSLMGAEVELFPLQTMLLPAEPDWTPWFLILSTVFILFTIVTIFCYQLIKKLKDIKT